MTEKLLDEFIVFSDHHAHSFTFGSKQIKWAPAVWEPQDVAMREIQGVYHNSRLIASCEVLYEIATYAKQYNIPRLVFTGDLFHNRDAVRTDAYNLTQGALQHLAGLGKEIYLLAGNHDYHDRVGFVHSLAGFRNIPGITVMGPDSTSTTCVFSNKNTGYEYCAHFVPYTDDRTIATQRLTQKAYISNTSDLLFAHLGMQGAKVGSDYVLVSDNDITVDDVPYDKFAGCFFGHYHQHQQLFRNGWYVGATHQHNWGDANTQRGFLHVKLYKDEVKFDFIETQTAPKFLVVNEADLENTIIRPNDFVKVLTKNKQINEQLENKIQTTKANYEIIYMPPEIKISNMELNESNLSPTDMVQAWVKANSEWITRNMTEVSSEDLVSYGRALLSASDK